METEDFDQGFVDRVDTVDDSDDLDGRGWGVQMVNQLEKESCVMSLTVPVLAGTGKRKRRQARKMPQ